MNSLAGYGSGSDFYKYATIAAVIVVSAAVLSAVLLVMVVSLLRRISGSVGLAEPTPEQLQEEDAQVNCPLFRHLPHLSKTLAWRSLGACSKTPVHVCSLPNKDDENNKKGIQVYLKREDLISPKYGGNKVRRLQHQLAICEARRERGEKAFRQLVSIGSGGSNQVVATVLHSQALGWTGNDKNGDGNRINPCWFDKDEPDLDNTLNMLSVLSFRNIGFTYDWGQSSGPLQVLQALVGVWTQKDFVPMMMGGNCPTGVLGQVGGVLELAEQIVAKESPDPERIYLAVGSACTISGLIVGTVLVRHLGLKALSHPNFKVVGCNVHEKFALFDRTMDFHINPLFRFMPLTISHSVLKACEALKTLGGPDLQADCLEFLRTSVELRADADVVGLYGGHSKLSREGAKRYDESGVVTDYESRQKQKELWVCGHFVSKAFVPLLQDLESVNNDNEQPNYMLWMTKSAVQPRGNENEWEKMQQQNKAVLQWANDGEAESKLRPGNFSTKTGKAEDYRSLMTQIVDKTEKE